MLNAFLFTAYAILFTWLVTRIPFFRKSGLGWRWLAGLFLLKVAAGCFYGYIHTLSQYYPDKIDTWRFYFQSLPETELLKKDPSAFLQSLFGNGYENSNGLLSNVNSYWNDLKHNLMLLLMSVFNLFSRGNYYINVIFYNFFAFAGLVALYRVAIQLFPLKKWVSVVCVFLVPTVVFWGSGFHKEGLLLSAIGLVVFQVYRFLVQPNRPMAIVYRLTILLLLFLLLLLLRPYLLFALLPALLAWVVSVRTGWKTGWVFGATVCAWLLLFFLSPKLGQGTNLPAGISRAQHDFVELGGKTTVFTDSLTPTPAGYGRYLPQALDMAFLRPRPALGEITYLPSALENIGLFMLLIMFLLFPAREKKQGPFLYFLLTYSVVLLLLMGYSVPVTGAIIRYKVLATPFLVMFFAVQINWKRVFRR